MFAVVELEECTRNAFTGRTSPRFLVVPSNKVHNFRTKKKYMQHQWNWNLNQTKDQSNINWLHVWENSSNSYSVFISMKLPTLALCRNWITYKYDTKTYLLLQIKICNYSRILNIPFNRSTTTCMLVCCTNISGKLRLVFYAKYQLETSSGKVPHYDCIFSWQMSLTSICQTFL